MGNHNSGGSRPGAGRKKHTQTIRTRAIANQLAKREVTPLHVLTKTMEEFWGLALAAPEQPVRLQHMRDACVYARDAAPFIHARLSSVSATVRKVTNIKDLSDDELVALAASVGVEPTAERPTEPDRVH
jgi:hypothetical protein